MTSLFQAVRVLRDEGKVHKQLITRVRLLLGISCVLALIVIYNVLFGSLAVWISLGIFALGLILGLFVFSRMSPVGWDEKKEIIKTGRMDIFAFIAIGLYIVFEISLRTFLSDAFPGSSAATLILLAGISGTLMGRSVGTLVAIHNLSQNK